MNRLAFATQVQFQARKKLSSNENSTETLLGWILIQLFGMVKNTWEKIQIYANLVSTALYTDPKDPSPIFSCFEQNVITYVLSIVLKMLDFNSKICWGRDSNPFAVTQLIASGYLEREKI
jgi:hypothetical protein